MCVLYVSFGYKVRPITLGCVAMGSTVLFMLRSRLILYSAGSGEVNRVQVVLYGFSVRSFCFVQAKTLCRYGCMYFLAALVCVCVCRCDGDVICVDHDLNWCSGWWYVCSVNVGEGLVKGRHLVERQF